MKNIFPPIDILFNQELIHKVNWWKYQQMHNKEESNHLKKKLSLPPFHYTVSEFETFLGPHLTQKGNVFKRKN